MGKLVAFNNMTVDGYFADTDGGISWIHRDSNDAEYNAFVADNAKAGDTLVFGRITYALMAGYWTTALASQNDPVVAERMNALTKLVFSRTLTEASWKNTMLVKGDLAAEIRKLKQGSGKDMAILGSGSLVSQLAQEGLIDAYQLLVNPVVLGRGRTMFDGLREPLNLTLTSTRSFGSGKVLLCYAPVG